jgi:hypothetical protein
VDIRNDKPANDEGVNMEERAFITPKQNKDHCPYCGFWFEKAPTRKKKCPECQQYIFVRFGQLCTEEEKEIFDWLSHYWIYAELGITRDLFDKTRQQLSREFGCVASVQDTKWRILNQISTPEKSFTYRKFAYQAMAKILEEEGKSADHVLSEAHKMEVLEGKLYNEIRAESLHQELLAVKESSVTTIVKVMTANDEHVCEECRKLSQKTFTLDEALKTLPIPRLCTSIKCRCIYGYIPSGYEDE